MGSRGNRNWLPVLPPAVLGLLVLALGHPVRAVPFFVATVVVALLIAAGVDVGAGIGRGAVAVGRGLSIALGGLLFVLVILPASAWSFVRRRGIRGGRSQPNAWTEHRATEVRTGALGSATPGAAGRRGLVGRLTWSIGCVVLVLAANYGLGWAWDRVTAGDGDGDAGSVASGGSAANVVRDPRADLPAMAAYPWREQYFTDIQRATTAYWPYTEYRPEPFRSPYYNVDGWTRRTYRTPGDAGGRPVVWMLGGSTTWGEGQRDEYTIASWLARFAEADGVPMEIRNYGQRAWTHFQEMVLYEQRLALDDPPDLSVFYDGVNETNTQALITEAVPSHYQVTANAQALGGRSLATRFVQEQPTSSLLSEVWHEYSQHSLVHKFLGRLDQPAGATALGPPGIDTPAIVTPTRPAQSAPTKFQLSPQDGIDAGKVYERIKRLTLSLSDRYGVDTFLYWQPVKAEGEPETLARAQLTPPTIDIAGLLADHPEVFIDGAHTNEEGARLVAERIWQDLEPAVRAWYRDQG